MARKDARSRSSGCSRDRTRRTRSRRRASPKRRRWGCAGAKSAGGCSTGPRLPRPSTARAVQVKVAQRPGGKRTAKAAHDDVVATRGLGARRRRRARRSRVKSERSKTTRSGTRHCSGSDDLARLVAALDRHERLAVAVSGGVDSMTLAHVAWRFARTRTTMYHATGPAVPAAARGRVEAHAATHGWPLTLLDAGEQADPRYRANPVDRCYYCKTNLYARIREATPDTIASGTNRDDLDDFRPGLRAAAERDVVHPYVEAGIDKARGVRARRAPRSRRSRAPSRRSRALRAASRPGSRLPRRISRSSIPSRRGLPSASGAKPCFAAA